MESRKWDDAKSRRVARRFLKLRREIIAELCTEIKRNESYPPALQQDPNEIKRKTKICQALGHPDQAITNVELEKLIWLIDQLDPDRNSFYVGLPDHFTDFARIVRKIKKLKPIDTDAFLESVKLARNTPEDPSDELAYSSKSDSDSTPSTPLARSLDVEDIPLLNRKSPDSETIPPAPSFWQRYTKSITAQITALGTLAIVGVTAAMLTEEVLITAATSAVAVAAIASAGYIIAKSIGEDASSKKRHDRALKQPTMMATKLKAKEKQTLNSVKSASPNYEPIFKRDDDKKKKPNKHQQQSANLNNGRR